MAGNNKIRFLRGDSTSLENCTDALQYGQPVYDDSNNTLHVGSSSNTAVKDSTPINAGGIYNKKNSANYYAPAHTFGDSNKKQGLQITAGNTQTTLASMIGPNSISFTDAGELLIQGPKFLLSGQGYGQPSSIVSDFANLYLDTDNMSMQCNSNSSSFTLRDNKVEIQEAADVLISAQGYTYTKSMYEKCKTKTSIALRTTLTSYDFDNSYGYTYLQGDSLSGMDFSSVCPSNRLGPSILLEGGMDEDLNQVPTVVTAYIPAAHRHERLGENSNEFINSNPRFSIVTGYLEEADFSSSGIKNSGRSVELLDVKATFLNAEDDLNGMSTDDPSSEPITSYSTQLTLHAEGSGVYKPTIKVDNSAYFGLEFDAYNFNFRGTGLSSLTGGLHLLGSTGLCLSPYQNGNMSEITTDDAGNLNVRTLNMKFNIANYGERANTIRFYTANSGYDVKIATPSSSSHISLELQGSSQNTAVALDSAGINFTTVASLSNLRLLGESSGKWSIYTQPDSFLNIGRYKSSGTGLENYIYFPKQSPYGVYIKHNSSTSIEYPLASMHGLTRANVPGYNTNAQLHVWQVATNGVSINGATSNGWYFQGVVRGTYKYVFGAPSSTSSVLLGSISTSTGNNLIGGEFVYCVDTPTTAGFSIRISTSTSSSTGGTGQNFYIPQGMAGVLRIVFCGQTCFGYFVPTGLS